MLTRLSLATRIVIRLFQVWLLLVWALIVVGITVASRIIGTSTDDKLRKLVQPGSDGGKIRALPCPRCATLNESIAETCFICGGELVLTDQQPKVLTVIPIVLGGMVIFILIILVLTF